MKPCRSSRSHSPRDTDNHEKEILSQPRISLTSIDEYDPLQYPARYGIQSPRPPRRASHDEQVPRSGLPTAPSGIPSAFVLQCPRTSITTDFATTWTALATGGWCASTETTAGRSERT